MTDQAARLLREIRENPPGRTGRWWDVNQGALLGALELARREVCGYVPDAQTCDCKYGLIPGMGFEPKTITSEHTGCPELRDLIARLSSEESL